MTHRKFTHLLVCATLTTILTLNAGSLATAEENLRLACKWINDVVFYGTDKNGKRLPKPPSGDITLLLPEIAEKRIVEIEEAHPARAIQKLKERTEFFFIEEVGKTKLLIASCSIPFYMDRESWEKFQQSMEALAGVRKKTYDEYLLEPSHVCKTENNTRILVDRFSGELNIYYPLPHFDYDSLKPPNSWISHTYQCSLSRRLF